MDRLRLETACDLNEHECVGDSFQSEVEYLM